jgi:predicted alpha/beta-hydrolase family hydrolase
MGYVNDTHSAQFIHPGDFEMSAGTWAVAEASNVVSNDRVAADAAVTVLIPIRMPSNESALKGAKLKSIDVGYLIGTAAADDFATVELEKVTVGADNVAAAGAAVATTEDAAHDSAAERLAADDHTMTVTVTTPEWCDDGVCYWLKLVIDCAATTVLKFYGAIAHFTLRQ